MKRELIITLLNKFKFHNVGSSTISNLLKRQEPLLCEVATLADNMFKRGLDILNHYSNDEEAKMAIIILKRLKFPETYLILVNECAISYGISLEAAKSINLSKHGFMAKYSYKVLSNEDAIKSKVALEGVNFIYTCTSESEASDICDILCNKVAIREGISIKIIELLYSLKRQRLMRCANEILNNFSDIRKEELLSFLKILSRAANLYIAESACAVFCNKNALEAGISLDGAITIINSKKWQITRYASEFLTSAPVIESGKALIGAKIICGCETEAQAKMEYERLMGEVDRERVVSKLLNELEDVDKNNISSFELVKRFLPPNNSNN